jgi:hypothetical protein
MRPCRGGLSSSSRWGNANDFADSELAREKMWSRIHLIPSLTAESDRDLVRRHYADLAREKELLGSNTKVYNSDKYVDSLAGFIGNVTNLYVAIRDIAEQSSEKHCYGNPTNIYGRHRFIRPTYAITPSHVTK